MICVPCRERRHEECPELARQASLDRTAVELSGGQDCFCAHQYGTCLRQDRQPDPRRGA